MGYRHSLATLATGLTKSAGSGTRVFAFQSHHAASVAALPKPNAKRSFSVRFAIALSARDEFVGVAHKLVHKGHSN